MDGNPADSFRLRRHLDHHRLTKRAKMAMGHCRGISRRSALVGLLAAALIVPPALLTWAPWSSTLPEVERGSAQCPSPSPTPPPGQSGTGPLVPDARYHMVQLCPPATAGRISFRVLNDQTSNEIVNRINALSTAPPSPMCATAAAVSPIDLVLRASGTVTVVRLDAGPCGSARHDGVVRYGADDLYRYTTELVQR